MAKFEKRQIKATIDKWRKILQIEPRWKIRFEIKNSPSEMSEGYNDAQACVDVESSYFSATIEFNAAEIAENELDEVVLHELLHIILEPLSCVAACGLGKKYEEMNTTLTESTIERLSSGYLNLYHKKRK